MVIGQHISEQLGVTESGAVEPTNNATIIAWRAVKRAKLEAWKRVGLEVGSEGVVRNVYKTGVSDVLFNPNGVSKDPFLYTVPTACLSLR